MPEKLLKPGLLGLQVLSLVYQCSVIGKYDRAYVVMSRLFTFF